MKSSIVVLAGLALLAGASIGRADGDGLTVRTANGVVHGGSDAVQKYFLNIPFGAPPVGALRWKPTQPPANWTGVRDATQFGPYCAQGFGPPIDSEDCLYLNVYVPLHADSSGPVPVMMFLFGGGDEFGDNTGTVSGLVAHGVIVVVPNYRLGVFGWFGTPELAGEPGNSSPNYGTYDNVAALQWIHQNIAAFGGDPGKVTIFGTSAGTEGTAALLASPPAIGLYQRAIVQGAFTLPFHAADMDLFGTAVAANAGCGPGTADVPGCLRALSSNDAMNAWNGTNFNGDNFAGPAVDGTLIADQPWNYIASHGSVPLITGYAREEGASFFYGNGFLYPDYLQDFANNWYQYPPGGWYPERTLSQFLTNVSLFPVAGQVEPKPRAPLLPTFFDSWSTFITDYIRACVSRRIGLNAIQHNPQTPVYRYVFEHKFQGGPLGSDPVFNSYLSLFPGYDCESDSFVFDFGFDPVPGGDAGEYCPGPNYPAYVPTAGELLLSQQMGQYYANFARTGDPNGPGLPPWPKFEPDSQRNIVLATPIGYGAQDQSLQCDTFVNGLNDEYHPMPPIALTPNAPTFGCGFQPESGITINCPTGDFELSCAGGNVCPGGYTCTAKKTCAYNQ